MKHFSGKHKLQIPERFLLFVGDRTPYKNFKRFMETFAQIHEQDRTLFAIYTGSKLKKDEQDMLIWFIIRLQNPDKVYSSPNNENYVVFVHSVWESSYNPHISETDMCHIPVRPILLRFRTRQG